MSTRDMKRDNDGNRYYYTAKDLQCQYRDDALSSHHLLKYVDVDYYSGMEDLGGRAACLYTFSPTTPSGSNQEMTWRTIGNEVEVSISGGATYRHQLWNWNIDHFTWEDATGVYLYLVESKRVNQHLLVFLNPIAFVNNKASLLAPRRPLERRSLSYGPYGMAVLDDKVWIQAPGLHTSVAIPLDAFSAATLRLRIHDKLYKPIPADFESLFARANVDKPALAACAYLKLAQDHPEALEVIPAPTVGRRDLVAYTPEGDVELEEPKTSGTLIGPKITNIGLCPTKCRNSDSSMLEHRLNAVASTDNSHLTEHDRELIEEFVGLMAEDSGYALNSLEPTSLEEVKRRQNRPTQKQKADRAAPMIGEQKNVYKTFQKAEVYLEAKAPRNITTVPEQHKELASTYSYQLSEVVGNCHWYAFSLSPAEIAKRVQEKLNGLSSVCSNDVSKMDGSTNAKFGDVLATVLCSFFKENCSQDILKILNCEA